MDDVIRKFYSEDNTLLALTKEELAILPHSVKEIFGQSDIHYVWDRLPVSFIYNPDNAKYRRCMKHYNLPNYATQFDGPPPMIKDCYMFKFKHPFTCIVSGPSIAVWKVDVLCEPNKQHKTPVYRTELPFYIAVLQ